MILPCRIHKDVRQTVDLCQKAESAGVSWITVHGRTSEERHQPVHYDAIKTIKDSVSVPVIANGDIKYLRDVESIHQLTGVDGKFYIDYLHFTPNPDGYKNEAISLNINFVHLVSRCYGSPGVACKPCYVCWL